MSQVKNSCKDFVQCMQLISSECKAIYAHLIKKILPHIATSLLYTAVYGTT